MADRLGHGIEQVATCEPCRKWIYATRKIAKKAASQISRGEDLRAYRCPANTDHWHLGHLSADVRHGKVGRDIYDQHRRRTA